jgi:putative transposase
MPRRLRIEFGGAVYHVINRGNYRRDVFTSVGAAQAFESTLAEACEHFGWQIHAYVIMRNHYHLALHTPEPNLVAGMQWLQSTFANRFNRFRSERGHLFQGRYQALLIENAHAIARVASYIHLNPVRAKIISGEQVGGFRWSSLRRFLSGQRPPWLNASDWLPALGYSDTPDGWRAYTRMLIDLSANSADQKEMGFGEMSRGWAIGTHGWRKSIAQEHTHLALSPGLSARERNDLRHAKWTAVLARALALAGKTEAHIHADAKSAAWKVGVADQLRREANAAYPWIASSLNMGKPASVRVYVSLARQARAAAASV